MWWKGTTYLSLGADQPTDNGNRPVFFPLELLLAGRMLETGAELAVQASVVGSLLRCTEKPWGSLRWARFYPEDVGDQIPFWPPRAGCRGLAREPASAASAESWESSGRAAGG